MDDGVIKIGTEVDISGIRAGMAEAQATIKASTMQMGESYKQLATATVQYATSQANLRNAIRQVADGTTAYSQAAKSLIEPLRESDAAARSLAAAKKDLAAANGVEAQSENVESQAVRSNITARMAASAELRVFEGNMMGSTRAAGAFLNMLPGMGSLLQSAFPVFGAMALGMVIVDVTKNMVKFSQDASDLAHETGTGWLDGAIGQFDGLKEAAKEADDEMMTLARDMDNLRKQGQNLAVEKIRLTQGEGAGYRAQIGQQQQYVGQQKAILSPLQSERNQVQGQLDAADIRRSLVTGGEVSMSEQHSMTPSQIAQARLRLQELDGQMVSINGHIKEANQQIEVFGLEAKKADEAASKKGAKEGARSDNAAAIQHLKQIEDEYDNLGAKEASVTGHGLTAGEGASFWAQYLTTFKAGSEEAKHILGEYVKDQEEVHKQFEAIKASMKKADGTVAPSTAELNKLFQEQADDVLRTGERWKEYNDAVAKGAEIQAHAKEQFLLATVNAQEASGAITKLAALHEKASIHAAEYATKLSVLNDELERLIREEKDYEAQNAGMQNPKNLDQQQQVKGQIGQVQGQAATSGVQDNAAIKQQIQSPYLKAFGQINSSWIQVQNQMMMSTRNLSMAFAKMGQSILISIVDNMEMAALKAIEKEAMMVIAHNMANQSKVASDAAAATESGAIHQAAGLKEAIIDAKNAAVAGWHAGMKLPFPADLVMAPLLAGIGFSGAMAHFEAGTGYVPSTGIAMLHEGEAVIPAPTMEDLRGSTRGGDISITQHNNITSANDKAIVAAINRNPHIIAGALRRHLRQGGH
jgi:hypothetical protein